MAEGLTTRVGRIISGSVNAIVEAVEDAAPEIVMQQAIREVDLAVDDVRAELGKVIASKHLANKRLAEKNAKHEEFSDKIDVAVKEGRDDLAEAAISHQLDIEAQIPVLESHIAECGEREKELEGYVTALKAKKREMEEDLKSWRETHKDSAGGEAGGDNIASMPGRSVEGRVDDAQSAFDRVLEKQSGISRAGGGATAGEAAKLAELEKIARENRIRERLAAVKSAADDDKGSASAAQGE